MNYRILTIPVKIFEKLEEILENYALAHLIEENEDNELLSVGEAKSYYINSSNLNETVVLERVLHRKDIYKFFP